MTRVTLLLAISGLVGAAAMSNVAPLTAAASQSEACSMKNSVLTAEALARLKLIVTDSGEYYVGLRVDAGLQSSTPADFVVVTDTIACRRAIDAMYSYYDTTSDSAKVRSVDSGLLVRAGVNRFILMVALFNPWSGSQWIVLDSSFNVVRHTL